MSDWRDKYKSKLITAREAVKLVKSNDYVYFSLGSTPVDLGFALAERASELRNVTVAATWGTEFPWHKAGMEESFKVVTGFALRPTREGIKAKTTEWLPWIPGLSTIERHVDENRGRYFLYSDVFLLTVTPPDEEGYCSFGHQVWVQPECVKTAKIVIAEVNPDWPRVPGPRAHISELDYLVEAPPGTALSAQQIAPIPPAAELEAAQVMGALAAGLVRDGDCLQVGVGTPSEAITPFLETKNDLGVDSEAIYPQTIELVRAGNINGSRKNINKGKVILTGASVYIGDPRTKWMVEFLDGNPAFEGYSFIDLCHIPRIASNDNMVTINTLLGIDLLGQGVLDHLGPVPFGGVGGGLEYGIASHYSKGGRSISCLMSTAGGGKYSRIVPQLEKGSVVELPMGYIDYLVTEYGVVNLECKTRQERAEAIISVAHPDFRPELMKAARELFYP